MARLYYACDKIENPSGNSRKLYIKLCSAHNKANLELKYSANLGDVIVGKKDDCYELKLYVLQNENKINYDAFAKCLDCVRSVAIKHNADVYMVDKDNWLIDKKVVNIIISMLISRNINVVVYSESV